MGGAGISLYNAWLEIMKYHDVSCYIPDEPSELKEFLLSKGLNPKFFSYRLGKITYYSGGNGVLNPKFWYHSLRAIIHQKKWKEIIKSEKPDLVIVNSIVLCWFSFLIKDCESICFVRETLKGRRKSIVNRIIGHSLEKFSMVSFLSNHDREAWSLKNPKTIVTYNNVVTSNFLRNMNKIDASKVLKVNSDSFNLLFVGGINRIKGTEVVVRAMRRLRDHDIELIIVGNNPGPFSFRSIKEFLHSIIHFRNKMYFYRIKKMITKNQLSRKIHYLGVQNDMRTVFDASDLLIVPMIKSHQARPVFEFGCQKKPVLISDFDNISEFLKDGYNGKTFSVGDDNELSKKIKSLYDNEQKIYQELGENNFLHAINNHERKKVMKELLYNINRLVA